MSNHLGSYGRSKVPVGEEPEDLIVLTDMGFDAAAHENPSKPKPFMLEHIRNLFKAAGERVWGQGWKPPRIVIWNLRADFKDFHATAHQEGVVQLSGWSPNMLKAIQKGGIQVLTPFQGMVALIRDNRYIPIVRSWQHSHLESRT